MLKKILSASLFVISIFCSQDLVASDNHGYKKINAVKLKRWIDEEKDIMIFDSRTPEYDDGSRIPHATLLPCDSSEKAILAAIPSKASTVVIYCTSPECIASVILSDRLVKLGYSNVYKYLGGLEDWEKMGYPLTQN